jgi:hypothetical protein
MTKPLLIPDICTAIGTVTFANYAEHLEANKTVYIVIDFQKYLVYSTAKVKTITVEDDLDTPLEIRISVQLKGMDSPFSLMLSEFNAQSAVIGEEAPAGNYSRIFFSSDRAKDYVESIKWVRTLQQEMIYSYLARGKWPE